MTTSFGMEGCALIDMCSKAIERNGLPKLQVAWIDTGFFFPETKAAGMKLSTAQKDVSSYRLAGLDDLFGYGAFATPGGRLWMRDLRPIARSKFIRVAP